MAKLLMQDLIDAGCKPRKPTNWKPDSYPFSIFGSNSSHQIAELFKLCDGGPVKRLNSEFLSLKEATRVWDLSFSMMEWRFFPFFWDGEHHSDPVVLGIDGPFQGFVFQTQHDGNWRILSKGLRSFVRTLATFLDNKRFFVEANDFDYPKRLDLDDAAAFSGLMQLSIRSTATYFSRSLFTELALSMVQDDQIVELLPSQMHPDSNSRYMIRRRLNGLGAKANRLTSVICGEKK